VPEGALDRVLDDCEHERKRGDMVRIRDAAGRMGDGGTAGAPGGLLRALPRLAEAESAPSLADIPNDSRGTCADARRREHLFRYSVRLLDEGERRSFEEHLQGCDECLDDVVAVWRVSSLLEEWVGRRDPAPGLPEMLRSGTRRHRIKLLFVAAVAGVAGFLLCATV
jgi:hypothetical protein